MPNNHTIALPPGQKARQDFPRFGVSRFAAFQAEVSNTYSVEVYGDVNSFSFNQDDLSRLDRIEQISDFHCVTTWSYCGAKWSGFRLSDVYKKIIQPQIQPNTSISLIAFRAHDNYKSSLPLEDALADDVLLADMLNDELLSAEHGAPLRLIAPAHYGYKSLKHLRKIELWQDERSYKSLRPRIMMHPRARVAYEERGQYLPGWIFRYVYRPLIKPTVRKMKRTNQSG